MSGSIGQNVTIANTGGAQADGLSVSAAVSDTSTTGQTGTVVSTQGTSYVPFVINPVIDPSITNQVSTASDPTTALQIETAITAAANYIDTHFTSSIPVGSKDGNGAIINAVTINIGFDYGTIETFLGNSVVAEPTTGTARSSFAGFLFNYSQVQSLLPNLPAVDPTNGGSFLLPDAQIKLLNATTYSNLPTSTSTEIDGYVGINTFANGTTLDWNVNSQSQPIAGENSAIGAIEHEITENFGRVSILGTISANSNGTVSPIYSLLDLFRYSGPGVRSLGSVTAASFGVNNGATLLAAYNVPTNGGDPGDWAASVTQDSFDAFLVTGSPGTISAADTAELNAIGLLTATTQQTQNRSLSWIGGTGTLLTTAANWNDITNGQDPASLAPASTDSVSLSTGGGSIGGTGSVAALAFGGPAQWLLGSDATLTATGTAGVTIGQTGGGELSLTSGATVISQGMTDTVSGTGAQSASLSVNGSGSNWNSAGALSIGVTGAGTLSVLAGGTATTGAGAAIASTAASSGSQASVNGLGSKWTITGRLNVGAGGSGALAVNASGSVSASSLDVGVSAAAIGLVSVTGTGSALTVTGSVTVGDSGTGALSILGGANLTAMGVNIGNAQGSSGSVFVSGAGSKLLSTGVLNIGSPLGATGGVGDLTVAQGAFVSAPVVNYYGKVVVENGTIDPILQIISSTGGGSESGLTSADVIINEGTLAAAASGTLVVQGTVVGGGGWTENGIPQTTAKPAKKNVGLLEIGSGATMELTGPVLNTATFTTTDNLTPTNTYAVSNSVIDLSFDDSTGVLKLDSIGGFAGTITGIQAGDAFVITGGTVSNIGLSGNNTITFTDTVNNAGTVESILFASTIAPNPAGFSIVNGNTIIACFAAGTKIATPQGRRPVETLAVGDDVTTVLGGPGRIVWTGSRAVDCGMHPRPETVWPVRIAAHSIALNVPERDLYVSPDHALYLDGVLIPARLLINGTTIRQIKRRQVVYHHIELEQHDLVLAEGMPAESYLDTGDKAAFSGGRVIALHPNFAAHAWEMLGCAPLMLSGPILQAARARLAANPLARIA